MKAIDVFAFGNYKGQRLDKAWSEHGNYVMWCLNNVKGFHIEPEGLEKKFIEGYHKWNSRRIK